MLLGVLIFKHFRLGCKQVYLNVRFLEDQVLYLQVIEIHISVYSDFVLNRE